MKEKVICDTNVWYGIAMNIYNPDSESILIPTSFSLYEIVSTELIARNPHLIQNVIKAVKTFGQEIIPVNPFDFIITNYDSKYQGDTSITDSILKEFSNVLNINMDKDFKISEDDKKKIIDTAKASRAATYDFATFGTEKIKSIHKNLVEEKGIKKRLKEDTLDDIKEMVKSLLNDYLKDKNYIINYDNFNWGDIELFLIATENYFKHLETASSGIKVDPNDAVDWLNMLYVRPGYRYLTLEKSWRKNILEDKRIAHYLYNQIKPI